jgi:hypothetical protein
MCEQLHGRVQQIVIDPEVEFATLRERFDYLHAGEGGAGSFSAGPETSVTWPSNTTGRAPGSRCRISLIERS